MKISVNYLTQEGTSLPSVEMLCEMATVMNVTVDSLLNDNTWDNRSITYMDTGLNTKKLYDVKADIMDLVSEDENLVSANFADATLFKMDTSDMKEPVYAMINCVPGSKEKYAREHGYDKEICEDVAANAINFVLQHGMKPVILQGMVLCGNNDSEQLYRMAQAVNYRPDEYRVTANLVAVQDKEKVISPKLIQEGDVLIGLRTEGINGINYPIVKVMMDRKPELAYAKIDEEHYFVEEMMKPNVAFAKEISALQKEEYLHGVFRIGNNLVNDRNYCDLQEGLGACIQLSAVPILPMYRFLLQQCGL